MAFYRIENLEQAQEHVRERLELTLRSTKLTLRQLAKSEGLPSHTTLSRFLRGLLPLTGSRLAALARAIGIDGDTLSCIIDVAVFNETCQEQPVRSNPPQMIMIRDYVYYQSPFVYELLRVLGPSTEADLLLGMNPKLGLDPAQLRLCLEEQKGYGFLDVSKGVWRIVGTPVFNAVPARFMRPAMVERLRNRLQLHYEWHAGPQPGHIVSQVAMAPAENLGTAEDHPIRHILASYRDKLANLTRDEDDTVWSVLISAVPVGVRKIGETAESSHEPSH